MRSVCHGRFVWRNLPSIFVLLNMISVLTVDREKRGISLVVWRHDGEPVDVRQNGSNGGADRSGSAYILDPIEHSVWLPYFSRSVLYPQKLKFPIFSDLTSCQLIVTDLSKERSICISRSNRPRRSTAIYSYIHTNPSYPGRYIFQHRSRNPNLEWTYLLLRILAIRSDYTLTGRYLLGLCSGDFLWLPRCMNSYLNIALWTSWILEQL
jgi:hypothetical protein